MHSILNDESLSFPSFDYYHTVRRGVYVSTESHLHVIRKIMLLLYVRIETMRHRIKEIFP